MEKVKIIELVGYISRKSIEGRIKWEPTMKEGVFQTLISNYSITCWTRSSNNSLGEIEYVISLYDFSGQLIDEYEDEGFEGETIEGEGAYTVMKQLHDAARRSALGVDQALDSILEELKKM